MISTVLGGLVVLIVGLFITNYFKQAKYSQQITDQAAQTSNEELIQTEKSQPQIYLIKRGDSLWRIAENTYGNGEYWINIAKENKVNNPDFLLEGQELILPNIDTEPKGEVLSAQSIEAIKSNQYEVKIGDSLWDISMRAYGTGEKWMEISVANKLKNPNHLEAGQILSLPR